MKVFKRPGSSYYAYKFQYRGKEYYRSTGTENRREAESIAAAARARIIRQAAGLEEPEPQPIALPPEEPRKHIPTLGEFQATFDEWVGNRQSGTEGHRQVLPGKLSEASRLRAVVGSDAGRNRRTDIEAFKTWALKHAGRAATENPRRSRRPR